MYIFFRFQNLGHTNLHQFENINTEVELGNILVFIRHLALKNIFQEILANKNWIEILLSLTQLHPSAEINESLRSISLRVRLMALRLLRTVLGAASTDIIKSNIVDRLLSLMYECFWLETQPVRCSEEALNGVTELDVKWDGEKSQCCTISDRGKVLAHGSTGRGFGICNVGMRKNGNIYEWTLEVESEQHGNEGTCVGVAKYPVKDLSHRTSSDMWLYRAYSGNVYHNGEIGGVKLPTFTHGDRITCILDTIMKTLAFSKNGSEAQVAFENIGEQPLYPCVLFYSMNAAEVIRISSVTVRRNPTTLHDGSPSCAPIHAIIAEHVIDVLRYLHRNFVEWEKIINSVVVDRLHQLEEVKESENKEKIIEEKDVMSIDEQLEKEDELEKQRSRTSELRESKDSLLGKIWCTLSLLSGVDNGLKMGGECLHKPSGRRAILLGVSAPKSTSVKVEWMDSRVESPADVLLFHLTPCEPISFDFSKLDLSKFIIQFNSINIKFM